jgi:hypothetical protein
MAFQYRVFLPSVDSVVNDISLYLLMCFLHVTPTRDD